MFDKVLGSISRNTAEGSPLHAKTTATEMYIRTKLLPDTKEVTAKVVDKTAGLLTKVSGWLRKSK